MYPLAPSSWNGLSHPLLDLDICFAVLIPGALSSLTSYCRKYSRHPKSCLLILLGSFSSKQKPFSLDLTSLVCGPKIQHDVFFYIGENE